MRLVKVKRGNLPREMSLVGHGVGSVREFSMLSHRTYFYLPYLVTVRIKSLPLTVPISNTLPYSMIALP